MVHPFSCRTGACKKGFFITGQETPFETGEGLENAGIAVPVGKWPLPMKRVGVNGRRRQSIRDTAADEILFSGLPSGVGRCFPCSGLLKR